MEMQIQELWTDPAAWRWYCPTCRRGGQWQYQSPDVAKHLGEQHMKRKHAAVARMDEAPRF